MTLGYQADNVHNVIKEDPEKNSSGERRFMLDILILFLLKTLTKQFGIAFEYML